MNMKHIAVAILMSDVAELATYRKSWQQITPKMGQDGHLGSTREAWLDSQAARSCQVGTTWDALSHLIAKEAAKMAPR